MEHQREGDRRCCRADPGWSGVRSHLGAPGPAEHQERSGQCVPRDHPVRVVRADVRLRPARAPSATQPPASRRPDAGWAWRRTCALMGRSRTYHRRRWRSGTATWPTRWPSVWPPRRRVPSPLAPNPIPRHGARLVEAGTSCGSATRPAFRPVGAGHRGGSSSSVRCRASSWVARWSWSPRRSSAPVDGCYASKTVIIGY